MLTQILEIMRTLRESGCDDPRRHLAHEEHRCSPETTTIALPTGCGCGDSPTGCGEGCTCQPPSP